MTCHLAMRRRLLNLLTVLSLVLAVAATGLWFWTGVLGHVHVVEWGLAGVFRCVEFSGDDLEVYVLSDPGFAPTPLRWQPYNGWARPPAPSNPAAVPRWSVTFMMPSPATLAGGRYVGSSGMAGAGRSVPATATHRGVPAAGFDSVVFPGWYGPGTSLRAYRYSYFLVLLPAAVLPTTRLVSFARRRFRFRRCAPGVCEGCGYDLRATPQRCPECGRVPSQRRATASVATAGARLSAEEAHEATA
jgi:hypothetical protein